MNYEMTLDSQLHIEHQVMSDLDYPRNERLIPSKQPGQAIFSRVEKKYLLSAAQYAALSNELDKHMCSGEFSETDILSLYLDTPDFYLIRQSIEKPLYKEKFRLRSYGQIASGSQKVFLEMKKKFKGKVYKRRVEMTYDKALHYLSTGIHPRSIALLDNDQKFVAQQILREFDWAFRHYGSLKPAMLISCQRRALVGKDDSSLRITFDSPVHWRTYALKLDASPGGISLFDQSSALMEIKCNKAMPLWLAELLTDFEAFPRSFSKYGTAYKALLQRERSELKGRTCA